MFPGIRTVQSAVSAEAFATLSMTPATHLSLGAAVFARGTRHPTNMIPQHACTTPDNRDEELKASRLPAVVFDSKFEVESRQLKHETVKVISGAFVVKEAVPTRGHINGFPGKLNDVGLVLAVVTFSGSAVRNLANK